MFVLRHCNRFTNLYQFGLIGHFGLLKTLIYHFISFLSLSNHPKVHFATEAKLEKLEKVLKDLININKKITDSSITAINHELLNRISKMEKDMESMSKEREEWEIERAEWKREKTDMQEAINLLKGEVASLRDRPIPEEGEITPEVKEAIKEELTKTLTERMVNTSRGSGGVAILFRRELQSRIQIMARDPEARFLWIRIELSVDHIIYIALCYFAPTGSRFAVL